MISVIVTGRRKILDSLPFRILAWIANNNVTVGFLLILPSLIGFSIFFAYPAGRAVYISLLKWNLLTDPTFVRLDNYDLLLHDKRFIASLRITAFYVLWNIPLQTALALFIAVVVERFGTVKSTVIRSTLILPWLIPGVVVALLWQWILDPSIGIMNEILKIFGISRQPFLGSPDQSIQTIAAINIWRHVGYTAILFYAGLKTIPNTLYEAAAIDGAGAFMQFRKITLPLLRPVLVLVLVTSIIGSFQIFDTVAVTTRGGPAGSTRVIIYYIFDLIFARRIKMGMASAASVILFSILIVVTIVQMRVLRAGQSDLADYQ